MSELNQKGSVRQLPPGKLGDIKKIFEDGEHSSPSKGEKPAPPARPPQPPNRVKSPVRQQQRPQSKLPAAQQKHLQHQASIAMEAAEHGLHLRDQVGASGQPSCDDRASNVPDLTQQVRDVKKLNPGVAGKFTASLDNEIPSQTASKGLERSTSCVSSIKPPKPAFRHSRVPSSEGETVILDNPLYGSFQEGTRAITDVGDTYAKVNKPKKETEGMPKKVAFSPEDKIECSIPRREAVRRNPVERRKTIAGCEPENEEVEISSVNVAQRTKFFDGTNGDKHTVPQKSDAVKRKLSLQTPKEFDEQQQNKFQVVNRTCIGSEEDNVYDPPWDLSKNPVFEKLKKIQPPPATLTPLSAKTDSPSNAAKCTAPPKPPAPDVTLTNSEISSHKSANKDNQMVILKNQPKAKSVESSSDSSLQRKVAPPPKPPRTHAHDNYLQVKVSASQNFDAKPSTANTSSQAALRKTVHVMNAADVGEAKEETEYLSVKDRISRMQQADTTSAVAPPLPSVSFLNKNTEQNILRNPAPSRPPPPRRRPNSDDSLPISSALSQSFTENTGSNDDGPVIIPVSPPYNPKMLHKWCSNMPGLRGRLPSDKLPPEPEFGKPSQRFPLRKSYSSECLHSSRGSSLNGELTDEGSLNAMSQSSYASQYEAVIDQDGYAVPHVFVRVATRKRHSIKEENLDISPGKFLTRIKGFSGDALSDKNEGNRVTSAQEQSLDKVNKKKMIMVKQKINQAYADIDIVVGGLSETGDSDWQVVDQVRDASEFVVEPTVLKKRIEYCASVRLISNKSIRRGKEYLNAIYPQLFEYCLVVGLRQLVGADGYEPYVIHKFPENVSSNLSVPNFCFPDATVFKPGSVTSVSESYSFVMTSSDGSRVYGYCRRIQPSDSSLPEVICIISPIDAFNMYNTLLSEIEARRRVSLDLASELIAASFGRPLPKPGKVCHIRTLDIKGDMETIFLNRSADSRLENVNYESPLYYLGTDRLVKVFSSMLMERRIILCSSNLSVLTQTVHALSALLYPFQWQHVYIPLLPHEMLDVLCAPVPFIVGVLTAFLPKVLKQELEEVLVVDLDKKNIVKGQGDESTILPKRVQKALKTAINMCKIDAEARNAQWLMVAEAFLRMFIETVGHFNNHIRTQQDGNRIFQKEGFILEVVSKEVREFLSWFTETQMFEVFIMNHVEKSDYGTSDLFLQRLAECKESKEESRRHKGLGAKVKNFGKALKTKLQAS